MTSDSSIATLPELAPVPQLPLTALAVHPDNKRGDLQITPEFRASIRQFGVLTPLLITRNTGEVPGDIPWLVRDGARRLTAAIAEGLDTVPVSFNAAVAGDAAAHYLEQVATMRHREDLTDLEVAEALFAASRAGASKAKLRAASGGSAKAIDAALRVGALPESTRTAASAVPALNLEDLAALSEFAGDPDATARLTAAIAKGNLGYQLHWERREIEVRHAIAKKRADLAAAGVRAEDEPPAGAVPTHSLQPPEDAPHDWHDTCPGRVEVFDGSAWTRTYCADPAEHGHALRDTARPAREPADPETARAARRLVIRGNKDWAAAQDTRREWLTTLLSRVSLPADQGSRITRYTAAAYLSMRPPVSQHITDHRTRDLQARLLGLTAAPGDWHALTDTSSRTRLLLLTLAPIAAANENAMGNDTWRTDDNSRSWYSSAQRQCAAAWLTFCQQLGYALSPIEKAVVAGETYQPDSQHSPPGQPAQAAQLVEPHQQVGGETCGSTAAPSDPDRPHEDHDS